MRSFCIPGIGVVPGRVQTPPWNRRFNLHPKFHLTLPSNRSEAPLCRGPPVAARHSSAL